MKVVARVCVAAILAAGPALAAQEEKGGKISEEQIRSGSIVDDGLDLPRIRSGTQYFEIHGSTRIARALGEFRLPTDDAGLSAERESRSERRVAAW
jgi:hypothetical protein